MKKLIKTLLSFVTAVSMIVGPAASYVPGMLITAHADEDTYTAVLSDFTKDDTTHTITDFTGAGNNDHKTKILFPVFVDDKNTTNTNDDEEYKYGTGIFGSDAVDGKTIQLADGVTLTVNMQDCTADTVEFLGNVTASKEIRTYFFKNNTSVKTVTNCDFLFASNTSSDIASGQFENAVVETVSFDLPSSNGWMNSAFINTTHLTSLTIGSGEVAWLASTFEGATIADAVLDEVLNHIGPNTAGSVDISKMFKSATLSSTYDTQQKLVDKMATALGTNKVSVLTNTFDLASPTVGEYLDYSKLTDDSGQVALLSIYDTQNSIKLPKISGSANPYITTNIVTYQLNTTTKKLEERASGYNGYYVSAEEIIYIHPATVTIHNTDNTTSTVYLSNQYTFNQVFQAEAASYDFYQSDAEDAKAFDMTATPTLGQTYHIYMKQKESTSDTETKVTGIDDASIDVSSVDPTDTLTYTDNTTHTIGETGKTVYLQLNVTDNTDNLTVPDAYSEYKVKKFNFTLSRLIDGTSTGTIKDLGTSKIKITFPLPTDYQSGDQIVVLNYHNGNQSDPTIIQATVNETAGNYSFYMSEFSPVYIVYGNNTPTVAYVDDTINVNFNSTTNLPTQVEVTALYEYQSAASDTETFYVPIDSTTGQGSVVYHRCTQKPTDATIPVKTMTYTASAVTGFNVSNFADTSNHWHHSTNKVYTDINSYLNTATTFNLEYQANATSTVADTLVVQFDNTTGLPANIPITIKSHYETGADVSQTVEVDIAATGEGTAIYNRPVKHPDNGSDVQSVVYSIATTSGNYELDTEASMYNSSGKYTSTTGLTSAKTVEAHYKEQSNAGNYITSTFAVKFVNENGVLTNRPTKIELPVVCRYNDNSTANQTLTFNINQTNSTFSQDVTFPSVNGSGSQYNSIEWNWPDVEYYSQTGTGRTATYSYTGQAQQESATVTVMFTGDDSDKSGRPASLQIPYMVSYYTGDNVSGTIPVTITGDTNTATFSYPRVNTVAGIFKSVAITAPAVSGYNYAINGMTITYTKTSSSSTNTDTEFTVKFDDSSNKAGKRPSTLTITAQDETDTSKTVAGILTISNNTTTTTNEYKLKLSIPTGKTYKIISATSLPEGYTAEYSGTTVTLKYTPEEVSKTYTVKFEGDVESVRPSSVTIKIKSGDVDGGSVTVSKDTNWTATTNLPKYVKGVEASWTPSVDAISNYSASIANDVITLKYTGTLTEEQKKQAAIEAAKANGTTADGETENDLYNFDKFDWIDYANKYPDLKKAFGYNKEQLYAHYIHYGIAEGRTATFTGKYDNVNEDILKAYFPEDYKYKVASSSEGAYSDITGNGGTTSAAGGTTVTKNDDGTTTVRTRNADGTTTETIYDADGNVISTKTYATGDVRADSLVWIYLAIAFIAISLGGVVGVDLFKSEKRKRLISRAIDTIE